MPTLQRSHELKWKKTLVFTVSYLAGITCCFCLFSVTSCCQALVTATSSQAVVPQIPSGVSGMGKTVVTHQAVHQDHSGTFEKYRFQSSHSQLPSNTFIYLFLKLPPIMLMIIQVWNLLLKIFICFLTTIRLFQLRISCLFSLLSLSAAFPRIGQSVACCQLGLLLFFATSASVSYLSVARISFLKAQKFDYCFCLENLLLTLTE